MWVKLDDRFDDHPKVTTAADQIGRHGIFIAVGFFAVMLMKSNRHLTDGFISDATLRSLPDRAAPKLAQVLAAAGLFDRVEGGYRVHDYHDYNPTADEVQEKRWWDRTRKELYGDPALIDSIRARDRDRCRYCGVAVNWHDRRGPHGAQYDHVIPRGPNHLDNVVVACRGCNLRKNNRTPEAAGMVLLPAGTREDPDKDQVRPSSEPVTTSSSRARVLPTPTPTPKELRTCAPGKPDAPTDAPAGKAHPIKALLTEHERLFVERYSEKPKPYNGADAKHAKDLLARYGEIRVRELLSQFFASEDAFICDSGHGFGVFFGCVNKLIGQSHGPPGKRRDVGRRLSLEDACQHTPACLSWGEHTKRVAREETA